MSISFGCIGNMEQVNAEQPTTPTFTLENLNLTYVPAFAQDNLEKNGFVVTPGFSEEMADVYKDCKKKNTPMFVTTDAVLHTTHIFFDYVLRILEIEKLYGAISDLTANMLVESIRQYESATNPEVKQAARLNIGFFSVPKKILDPDYEVLYDLETIVAKEITNIKDHDGIKFRELLTYVENPSESETPYAFADYTQFLPRGHYTRNKTFEDYFRVMMWYGQMDFKLKPGKSEPALTHGRKMTLQALLISDALMKNEKARNLWKQVYEPTVFFVGKSDDLTVDDYINLINATYAEEGSVDRYGNDKKLASFIESAMELRPPKIVSGISYVEEGEFADIIKGFRFMGQRFIPDSYMFQELVFGVKDGEIILRYTGEGEPFTMESVPIYGKVRAFPRGLDVCAVLSSERALEILERDGDTDYTHFDSQMNKLKKEFGSVTVEEWQQNLYWRWLHSLMPLFSDTRKKDVPEFMRTTAWLDKELQTAQGSWAELRHDTILYAKQSYTRMALTALQPQIVMTHGYVEPYPEIYERLEDMMKALETNLSTLNLDIPEVSSKLSAFQELLDSLTSISEKELNREGLTEEDYELIWNFGGTLESLTIFPADLMNKITSGTDTRMDAIADVHTDPNTKQVLEVGVGSPFNIFVIVNDQKGKRLCQGAVFSYYEFKQPMSDRLTDEKWQQMQQAKKRPDQPDFVDTFTAR